MDMQVAERSYFVLITSAVGISVTPE